MPIYEYRCGACGYQKEFLQRLSDKPLAKCPECGKRALNKVVTAAGFQLKGTGWYATDFKNSGAKPAAKQDKAESKKDQPADGTAKKDQPADGTAKKEPSKPAAAKGSGARPACS